MKSRSIMETKLLVKILAVLLFMAVVLFAINDPVIAKGPESVTITGPGIDQPINLMDNNDIDLEVRLMEQMGLWYGTGIPLNSKALDEAQGPRYTLTWVNSGPPSMTVEERTIYQYIYLNAESGPLIHTPDQDSLRGWGSGVIGWFIAPGELEDTLTELGAPISPSSLVLEAHLYRTAGDMVLPVRQPARAPWFLGVIGFALFLGLAGVFGARLLKGKTGTS